MISSVAEAPMATSSEDEVRGYLERPTEELILEFTQQLLLHEVDEADLEYRREYFLEPSSLRPWRLQAPRVFADWMRTHNAAIRERICVEWDFCTRRNDGKLTDYVDLITGVADAIASICIGVPPFLLSTILIRLGLAQYCDCDDVITCQSTTRKGRRCSRIVRSGQQFCWQHGE